MVLRPAPETSDLLFEFLSSHSIHILLFRATTFFISVQQSLTCTNSAGAQSIHLLVCISRYERKQWIVRIS